MKKSSLSTLGVLTTIILVGLTSPGHAQLINAQFGALPGQTAPVYLGQGVLPGGTTWDQIAGTSTNAPLDDASGHTTSVTLTTSSVVTYDQQNTSNGNAQDALLQNILYTFGQQPITLTLNGLHDNATYDLVIYNGGNPTNFSVNGSTAQTVEGDPYNASATFVSGTTYTEFTAKASPLGVLTIVTSLPTGAPENDISGLQLEMVPEPSTYAMLALGLGCMLVASRFSQRRRA